MFNTCNYHYTEQYYALSESRPSIFVDLINRLADDQNDDVQQFVRHLVPYSNEYSTMFLFNPSNETYLGTITEEEEAMDVQMMTEDNSMMIGDVNNKENYEEMDDIGMGSEVGEITIAFAGSVPNTENLDISYNEAADPVINSTEDLIPILLSSNVVKNIQDNNTSITTSLAILPSSPPLSQSQQNTQSSPHFVTAESFDVKDTNSDQSKIHGQSLNNNTNINTNTNNIVQGGIPSMSSSMNNFVTTTTEEDGGGTGKPETLAQGPQKVQEAATVNTT